MMQLINGDCLEKLGGVQSASIDLILTDLPYGITRNKWDSVIPLDKLWKQYTRIIKPSGAIALFGGRTIWSKTYVERSEVLPFSLRMDLGKDESNWLFKCKKNAT